ncbi:MAG: bifunctional riboflavin kinase/FAD synthetase [Acetobacteraceae bacterium]|nr:bifunctional riboflavin kinase/FAD synthetase [Acetobacteraceae bacterium]
MTPELFRDWRALPPAARGAAVALGNFDGVHLGHAAVIEAARAPGRTLACLTFEPHPREFFRPADPPFRLMLAPEKADALGRLGVRRIFELPFDAALSHLAAEDFVRQVLVGGLGVGRVACGPDFVFGHRRGGDVALLGRLAEAHGFEVAIAAPVIAEDGTPVSSTAVRQALAAGELARVHALLGREHVIAGEVVHGDKLGRTLGFPTANIPLGRLMSPRHGIYAVSAEIDGVSVRGVANVGTRPTVRETPPMLEVFFFDFAADLYGRRLAVRLHHFLRQETRFPTLAAMTEQIVLDAAEARRLLDASPPAA